MKQILPTLLLLFLFSQIGFAQAYWEGREYIADGVKQPLLIDASKEEASILKSRWAKIGEDIESTENSVEGSYIRDGNRGEYLRFSSENGYVLLNHYENIDLVNYSYGRVEINGSEITFFPEKDLSKTEQEDNPRKFPRKWIVFGRTLVEEDKVKDYADYLSGLGDYNNWNCECMAFFRKTSKKRSPTLTIPEKYKSLFRPPIKGKIIFVGDEKIIREKDLVPQIQTQTKINVGRKQGVTKGMIFRFLAGKNIEREMTVTQVHENSSLALISDGIFEEEKGLFVTYYDHESNTEKPMPKTKAGTKISTELFPWIYEQE